MHRLVARTLAALVVLAALLTAPVHADADSVGTLEAQVAKLRREADKATASLAKNTRSYEAAQRRLRLTQRRLLTAAQTEQRAQDDVDEAHRKLVGFAASAYVSPTNDEIGALLDNTLTDAAAARSTVDVSFLTRQQAATVSSYQAELTRQRALRQQAKRLERAASDQQSKLASQQKRLQAESKRITGQLLAKLDQLTVRLVKQDRYRDAFRVSRERLDRSGADTAACEKPTVGGFPNGLIPTALLCPLPQRGEYLRADAARAFWLLDTAYRMRFDSHICVTDSYRPLSEQYAVYRTKPGLAAVPGTSRHGRGVAVDLGCGIQTFGSTQFRWMKRNAPKFGWVHPPWAENDPFEPWHWEYDGRR